MCERLHSESYSLDERAAFANYGYYAMLLRAGVDYSEIGDDLTTAERGCRRIMANLDISDEPSALLYSPIQQAPAAVLAKAQEL